MIRRYGLLACLTPLAMLPREAFAQAAPQAQASPPAQTVTAAPAAAPAAPSSWASSIKLGAQIEAGISGNPQDPDNGVNFGQLFTDKANHPLLNQLLLTAERDNRSESDGLRFRLQAAGMYGSDARITHTLGVFDHLIHDRNQIDIVEANVTMHTPWLFSGGIDVKAGIYPTPLGAEVIDAKANPFYSHSYIFNFGLPLKHLGILTTSHVSDMVDIYFGIDSGTNTSVGSGDDNGRPGGIAGVGLNLLGGNLTVLALTHMGPEDATRNTPFGNSAMRYYNDIVATYKYSDPLSFTTELNYVKEDGFRAEGYGIAQYAAYTLSDTVTLNARAEVWRDNSNFFVANPVNNLDFVNFELGNPSNFYTATRPTTYSEFTIGATYKPAGLPAAISTLMIRPELRYDTTLNNSKPFDGGKDKGYVTLASDIILAF